MKINLLAKARKLVAGETNTKETSTIKRQSTVLSKDTPFVISEAYKTARTNIMFASAGETGGRVILITSASPSEGKTTTSLNLAVTFAQTGAKTIIIDGDMRKPRIHRHLALSKNDGLSDVLTGFKTKEEAIHKDVFPNLDFMSAGQLPPNPSELLALDNMSKLLKELADEYEFVFIDTPPVTVVTDAVTLAKDVSGVICVVKANQTLKDNVKTMIESLEFAHAKIFGFILNGAIPQGVYGGSYKNKYKYMYKNDKYDYKYAYGDRYKNKTKDKEKSETEQDAKEADVSEELVQGEAVSNETAVEEKPVKEEIFEDNKVAAQGEEETAEAVKND